MKARGYNFVEKREELADVHDGKLLALFAPLDMDPCLDRGPVLEDGTMKAIELLSKNNKKGFFLMVEGSQIDDWAHRNKVGYMAEELFDFDKTIGKVRGAQREGPFLHEGPPRHRGPGLRLRPARRGFPGRDGERGSFQPHPETDQVNTLSTNNQQPHS